MNNERLDRALGAIDQANGADPNTEMVAGQVYPKELLYATRMTQWLFRLRPEAGEMQQLAARAQHICRWEIPRSDYPLTREGYLRWRTQLYRFHSEKFAAILEAQGYDKAAIDQAMRMVGKQGIKRDADVQLIEDVACLVFLEHYFPAFVTDQPPEKIVDIVRKTWKKMSDEAQRAALTIHFPDHIKPLLTAALTPNVSA